MSVTDFADFSQTMTAIADKEETVCESCLVATIQEGDKYCLACVNEMFTYLVQD